jgi:hypothetical protein
MAQSLGAQEALYLDTAEHRFLEEAGSANIVLKMKDGTMVTPESESIAQCYASQRDDAGIRCSGLKHHRASC